MVLIFSWIMVFMVGSQNTIGDITLRTLLFLVLSGLATGASWLCYFRALQIGDINKVIPVDKSSTVLTMLLAFIFLHEELNGIKVISMVLIAVGTFLMIQKKETSGREELLQEKTKENGKFRKWTEHAWLIYALGSAVFASLTSILGKVGIQGVESNLGTAIRTIVVLIMAWIVVFVSKKQHTIRSIDGKSGLFLILSGLATGGSWLCYYRALQSGPASVVVPIDKLSLLVTIGFSYLVFHEKLSKKSAIGLVLLACVIVVIVGIFITAGIENNMKRISRKFGDVAQGDLTVTVSAKGHDEFQDLAGSATNMITNTKKLVNQVSNATGELEVSAQNVGQASELIHEYSQDITRAIGEINEGMEEQSRHAQECVEKTDVLSNEMQWGMASIPLADAPTMHVGYIMHDERKPSPLLQQYLDELNHIIHAN